MLQCPLQTLPPPLHPASQTGAAAELRAYKLGQRRWSYNALELSLRPAGGGGPSAAPIQAVTISPRLPAAHQESAVAFLLHLDNGAKVQAHVYCCYDDAQMCGSPGGPSGGGGTCHGLAAGDGPSMQHCCWNLVTRQHCCKGCQGPVLRAIQRFGPTTGKRTSSGACKGASAAAEHDSGSCATAAAAAPPSPGPLPAARPSGRKPVQKKDPRFMYLSLDEACTHVGATAFRLVAGIYNRQGTRLLGTAVSPPIRVLANNDVPTGAARIPLEAVLPADWEGWSGGSSSKRGAPHLARRRIVLSRAASTTSPQQPGTLVAVTPRNEAAPCPPAVLCTPTCPQLPASPHSPEVDGADLLEDLTWLAADSPRLQPRPQAARQVSFAAALPPVVVLPSCGALPTGGCNSPDGSCGFSPFAMLPPAAPWPPAAGAPTHSDQLLQMAQFSACAAQREAERQLSLLQQLKCSLAASANPIESSCNSHHGALQQQRQGGDSLVSELQQQASPMPRTAFASAATTSPGSVGCPPSRKLQALPSLPWGTGGAAADADEFELQLFSLERSCNLDALGSSELDSLLGSPSGGPSVFDTLLDDKGMCLTACSSQ